MLESGFPARCQKPGCSLEVAEERLLVETGFLFLLQETRYVAKSPQAAFSPETQTTDFCQRPRKQVARQGSLRHAFRSKPGIFFSCMMPCMSQRVPKPVARQKPRKSISRRQVARQGPLRDAFRLKPGAFFSCRKPCMSQRVHKPASCQKPRQPISVRNRLSGTRNRDSA